MTEGPFSLASLGIIAIFAVALVATHYVLTNLKWNGGFRGELVRKIIHSSSAFLLSITPLVISKGEFVTILLGIATCLSGLKMMGVYTALHTVVRKSWGDVLFPAGVALSAFVFLPEHFSSYVAGMFVLALADPAAALVGIRYGTHHLPFGARKKTIEGSAVFAILTLAILVASGAPLGVLLVTGVLILTIVEAFTGWGIDNLLLPILGSSLLFFLI